MAEARQAGIAEGWAREEVASLEQAGLRRTLEPLLSPQGARVQLGAQSLINFSANDYLGLAADPRVVEAARSALLTHGTGSGASRLVVGDSTLHQSLEARLAAFERTEAAVLFNSGYAANVGTLGALLGPSDAVFSDALNHASIIDGCRLSRAKVQVYRHADVSELERMLEATPARRKLVVTDSVFSMDGDLAPLGEISEVCRRHGAALMVDEAHATGVWGLRGSGLVEALGLEAEVELRMGTLGKALGVVGAYVACSRSLASLLLNRARSLVFSTSLPPAVCAAAQAAVELCEGEPSLRAQLWRNIHHFQRGLLRLGLEAQASSAIFPVLLGAPERALAASRFLRERGLLVKAIRPPTVAAGTSRLRFALSAAHTPEHLDLALAALGEWKEQP